MQNKGDFLAGLLAGAVAGAAAALLLTPKSGSEARELIADRAVRLRERTEGQISNIRNRVRGARDDDEEEDSSSNLSD